jgi:hypothetical protein
MLEIKFEQTFCLFGWCVGLLWITKYAYSVTFWKVDCEDEWIEGTAHCFGWERGFGWRFGS